MTYEAEADTNTLTGSARVSQYDGASGDRIVVNVGHANDSSDPGVLRFNNVVVPADGRYRLTFFHVSISTAERTAVITASGAPPVSVTVTAGSTCCTSTEVTVSLKKGTNTVTFSNPTGHAPSVDRIVISGL